MLYFGIGGKFPKHRELCLCVLSHDSYQILLWICDIFPTQAYCCRLTVVIAFNVYVVL